MYIKSLDLSWVRRFTQVTVAFNTPDERPLSGLTVLLGQNGVGKTTLLQSIALFGAGPDSDLNLSSWWAAWAPELPRWESLWVAGSGDIDGTRMRLGATDIARQHHNGPLVAGYGATRFVRSIELSTSGTESENTKYAMVRSLFERGVPLRGPTGKVWNCLREDPNKDSFLDRLGEALPGVRVLRAANGDVFFVEGHPVSDAAFRPPSWSISEGQSSMIGLVLDVLGVLAESGDSAPLTKRKAVALVDEVDLHLHPRWQGHVLRDLCELFPNVQWIVTTHSPLVAASLPNRCLRAFRSVGGNWEARPSPISVEGMSPDRVLLSEYFGLESVFTTDRARRLAELAHRAMEGDAEARREYIKAFRDRLGADS